MSFEDEVQHIISIAVMAGHGTSQSLLPKVIEDNVLLILAAHKRDMLRMLPERVQREPQTMFGKGFNTAIDQVESTIKGQHPQKGHVDGTDN